jgi:hypothetical protein
MSKLERMKKQAELAKKEQLDHTTKLLKETGLEFVDNELPPDEVDEKEVERSLWTSLMTFIPGTNEYYEAKAAEDEMDDLKKIRIEKVRAADLYALTKIGRHEEALDKMMLETNNDFFYFNKLKFKMENEGKWSFDFKNHRNTISNAALSGAQRNRLRKAANSVYGAMDSEVTEELARLSNIQNNVGKKHDRNLPCSWRGKNKDGEALKCENHRMDKPKRPDDPKPVGNRKNDLPEVFSCCAYHVPHCVSISHEPKEDVKIKVPNSDGLCAECFMIKRGRKPPMFTVAIVPGVVPTAMAKTPKPKTPTTANRGSLQSGGRSGGGGRGDSLLDYGDGSAADWDGEDGGDGFSAAAAGEESAAAVNRRKKFINRCKWAPNPDIPRVRGYECCNDKLVHPETKLQMDYCVWHCTTCIRDHPPGSNAVVTVANKYGLCAQHYLAEMGHPVQASDFPYPGMQIKLAKDHWKGKRHYAVPRSEPPPVIEAKPYEEPPEPHDWVTKVIHFAKVAVFKR